MNDETAGRLFPAGIPRINHVAMSVPADALDASGRQAICEFYGACLGWVELDSQTVDRRTLVLAVGHWDQFLFIHAEEEPMRTPRMDHFGISVGSIEDLEAAHSRVSDRAALDPRIDVIPPQVDDFGVLRLHSFYVRHLLPMMVEVQHWEFT